MTTRDELAKGPRFEEFEEHVGCIACGDVTGTWTEVDKTTGLCRPCWRAWRFGTDALTNRYARLGMAMESQCRGRTWWRKGRTPEGHHIGVGMSFSLCLLEEAGGFDRLLAEWEMEPEFVGLGVGYLLKTDVPPEKLKAAFPGACPSCGAVHRRPAAFDGEKFRLCTDPWHQEKP